MVLVDSEKPALRDTPAVRLNGVCNASEVATANSPRWTIDRTSAPLNSVEGFSGLRGGGRRALLRYLPPPPSASSPQRRILTEAPSAA